MRLNFSNSQQLTAFLLSIVIGAVFCAVYDLIRVILHKQNPGGVVVFLSDVLFLCTCGIITFVFFLLFFKGMIRVYVFLGEALGFVIFRFTVSSLWRRLWVGCGELVNKIVEAILFPLKKLLVIIKKHSKKALNKTTIFFRKKIKLITRKIRKKQKINSKSQKNRIRGEQKRKKFINL